MHRIIMPSIVVPLLALTAPAHAQEANPSDSEYLLQRAASLTARIDTAVRSRKLSEKDAASLLVTVRKVQALAGDLHARDGTVSRSDADNMNQQLTDVERTLTHQPGSRRTATGGETTAMAATFRYMFASNASALRFHASSYCVGIGSGANLANPGPQLIKALAAVRPKVVPASSCRQGTRVIDGAGKPSIVFHLATVQCDGLDNCLFDGGYYEGNLSASHGRYRARWIDGKWRITPEGSHAIS